MLTGSGQQALASAEEATEEAQQPVVSPAVVPSDMDSGRPQVVSAAVSSLSAQGIDEVRLEVLGASVPMLRGAGGRYTAEFTVPPVKRKTVTRLSVAATDGNGQVTRLPLNESTIWPARGPVLHSVAAATTQVEPGDLVPVHASVTADSHRGTQQVVVYDGERGVGVLRPAAGAPTGTFSGSVYVGDARPRTTLRLTAVAEDANGKRSAPLPLDLAVTQSTRPQIVASRLSPHRAVLVGQPIELNLEARSPAGLKQARLAIAGALPVELSRVSGDQHHGVYRGTWTPPGIGDYALTLEALDVNGRKAERDLSIEVVGEASAEVADVSGPATLHVSPGWAMLTITAAAEGQVDQVWAECGDTATAMTLVSAPTFRQTISLPPDTAPGELDCAVRAVDAAGLSSAPKHLIVEVKRVTTFQRLELNGRKVRGALYAVDGTGGAYGHLNDAKVDLLFRKEGSSTFRRRATVVTKGRGEFSKKLPTKAKGDWKVVYRGSSDYTPVKTAL